MSKRIVEDVAFLDKGRIEIPGLSLTDALFEKMAEAIGEGKIKEGLLLPPLRKLAKWHEVGIITVKNAIEKLIDAGLVEAQPRIGYRVVSQKNNTVKKIGFIDRNYNGVSHVKFFERMEATTTKNNQVLMISTSGGNTERENECIRRFRQVGVDALVVVPAFTGKKSTELGKWVEEGHPIVLEGVSSHWKLPKKISDLCPKADVDNEAGMEMLLNYLISLGHKKILLASADEKVENLRLLSYKKIMTDKKLKPIFIENKGADFSDIVFRKIEKNNENISAVICTNDDFAIELLDRLQCLKSKRLKNLSITGFENQATKKLKKGSILTTIDFPFEVLADRISDLINTQLYGQPIIEKTILIPPKLIFGNTCKPALNN